MPSRDMLRELMQARLDVDFELIVSQNVTQAAWWTGYLGSLKSRNWQVSLARSSRYTSAARQLLQRPRRLTSAHGVPSVCLRFNPGRMVAGQQPLISTIADLSTIRRPRQSSLSWHGRLLFSRALADSVKHATRMAAVSQYTASDLGKLYPAVQDRIRVVPNGLGQAWLSEARRELPAMRHASGRPYWIWYGQVTPRKNIPGLLEAYAQFLRRTDRPGDMPDLRLVATFVGGDLEFRRQVERLDLRDRVFVEQPRPVEDLVSLVAGSRGLVFPSFFEGFGMPIVEALACGLPVMTSNSTAMPEVAGGHAVLCDPDSVGDMAGALARLADPAQWSDAAIAPRRKWALQFTPRRAAEGYSALIDESLAERVIRA